MSDHLIAILERSFRPRILVVGDLILDRYLWGNVDRISPEAPIPLLRVDQCDHRLGGAGSVVTMLAALDAVTMVATIVGDDTEGRDAIELLEQVGVDARAVLTAHDRPTTVKERFLGRAQSSHAQQIVRVDYENDRPLASAEFEQLFERTASALDEVDVVLVSDYRKGVCSGEMVPRLVKLAAERGVPVVADPVRGVDYSRYAGCACITPNRLEAAEVLGTTIDSPEKGLSAAEQMLDFGVESAIVTLDRDGMAWASRGGGRGLFPVRPRQVYDITGAGDMVLSIIGYYLAAGLQYEQILDLANLAGGLEVERLGVVPLTRRELIEEIRHKGSPEVNKIVSSDALRTAISARRAQGQRIVMTNGCFDLLHPGHVASLQEARSLGDCLVVGLNSDASVRALKAPGRPVIDQDGRAEMLAALSCVDYVVVFDDESVAPLVAAVLPDVLAKAAEYAIDEVVGHEIVERCGGEIVLLKVKSDYSTTNVIQRIRNPSEGRLSSSPRTPADPTAGTVAAPNAGPTR